MTCEGGEGVDRLLAEIARRGLLLHNLFQLDGQTWRANVRSPYRHCHAFGEGRSAVQALRQALAVVPEDGPARQAPAAAEVVMPRKGGVKIVRRGA